MPGAAPIGAGRGRGGHSAPSSSAAVPAAVDGASKPAARDARNAEVTVCRQSALGPARSNLATEGSKMENRRESLVKIGPEVDFGRPI